MPDDINALREELFATLRGLRNKAEPPPVEIAHAVVDVARVIVDSARVEVDMAKVTGANPASGFIPLPTAKTPPPKGTTVEPVPGGRVITHRMQG